MKKIVLLASTILTVVFVFTACNKTKTYTNRLDGGKWLVTEISVDGIKETELPKWEISDCDAYKESCIGQWKNHHEDGSAEFAWQFRENGGKFEISNQTELSGNHEQDEATLQCQNFSGTYEVVENKRKSMEFKSMATLGFSGQTVIIKVEKE